MGEVASKEAKRFAPRLNGPMVPKGAIAVSGPCVKALFGPPKAFDAGWKGSLPVFCVQHAA